MTGGAFFPTTSGAEEYELDESGSERHAVQWVGTPGVKGPRWARMPLLTVGMLGIQVGSLSFVLGVLALCVRRLEEKWLLGKCISEGLIQAERQCGTTCPCEGS